MNARPVRIALWQSLLGMLTLALTLQMASATPPQPPASLVLPESMASDKEVVLESAVLPLQVIVREEGIESMVVVASVIEVDPGKPEFAQGRPRVLSRMTIKPNRERASKVELPLEKLTRGDWKLEVRLVGKQGETDGFSNVLVRYLRVDERGRITVMTPTRHKLQGDAIKQQRFDEARAKDPRVHPIRELFGDTAAVPDKAKIKDGSPVPENRRIEVRPSDITPYLREHSVDSTATSYTTQDPITVRGRFMFQDIDGVFKPLVNGAVHLWDSDTFGDEHLGMVATDWDGRWSFTVNNDDGWFQDGRDIYYTLKLDTTRLSLGTCNFLAGSYEWKSAVHNDLSDGTVLDFGNETATTDMDALKVWSTLNLAWNHSVTVGGFDPGKVDGCFPGSGTFFNGKINIEAGDVDGPDSITHEYGHGVMARAYSGGDPSPGGSHGFGDCGQNQALSWSEGWATGFMLTLRQDGRYNWHEGDTGRAIENFSSTCQTGESTEGRVAAAVLDMFDNANDDNGGNLNRGRNGASDSNAANTVALSTMLRDTMVGTQHHNVIEFWNDLGGELSSAQRPAAQTIMNYNWMPVLLPSSCVATKVASENLRPADRDSLLGGLRKFRDHAMLPWPGGRELANVYYRNSPEIALILLKNPTLVPDAMTVMKHFSSLGSVLTTHKLLVPFALKNAPLVSPEVHAAAQRVIAALASQGSDALRRDAERIKSEFDRLRDMRLSDVEKRAEQEKSELKKSGKPLEPLRRQAYSPASAEALSDKRIQGVIARSFGSKQPR
ncbi:MAG: hypothetical protein KGL90_10115 [Burkholderiales bacterium]|nr:hypothetical protein [Burkholderiales bacterium]